MTPAIVGDATVFTGGAASWDWEERWSQVDIWMAERVVQLDWGLWLRGASPGLGLSTQQSGGGMFGWGMEETAVLAEWKAGWKLRGDDLG